MLTILIGTDWKANRAHIMRSISLDVLNQKTNRVLIVPELISHDTERLLATSAGDTASLYAEVLSFTRLARRIAELTGPDAAQCLDNGGRVVAMAAAIRQIGSKLKAYSSLTMRPEFFAQLVDAVDEFKRCCISAADLMMASQRTEGAFAQKLEELSMILEAYDAVTSHGKKDPRDQMTWLLQQLETMEYGRDHIFYIDGFPDFTRQHMAILEHFLLESPDVTISFTCDQLGSQSPAFEKASKTALSLVSYARNNGIDYKIINVDPTDSALNSFRTRLFYGSTEQIPGLSEQVSLYRCESIYDECSFAAERILSLIRSGSRFRDIAVVCSEMNAYEDALRLAFTRSNIPLYRSGTDDILQKSVIHGLLSAMNAALSGFEQQDVFAYMKSVLSPLTMEQCDLVENYCILWGIRGKKFLQIWQDHPEGLGGVFDDDSNALIADLECFRKQLVVPLERLRDSFNSELQLGGKLNALLQLFDDIKLAECMERLAFEMESRGDYRSAQILNQLWDILLGALEQLSSMLNDSAWDSESFIRLFTLLLGQYDVGTIPSVLDAVSTGTVSAMRCHQVKHLIILGAKEGALPGYNGTAGILTDREREHLRGLDVPLTGGGMEGLESEFADIYGVFCAAEKSIAVTCGTDQPSFLYNRLLTMVGTERSYRVDPSSLIADSKAAAAFFVGHKDQKSAEMLSLGEEYAQFLARVKFDIGTIDKDQIAGIYGNRLNLSASQVDKQADCRFSYFMRYGLRAKELKEASVDPAEFGTYFHAVLERTASHVMSLGGFHKVSLEDTVELAMLYSAQYIAERFGSLDSSRMNYLFERNIQELKCLIRELWLELSTSEFVPDQFEIGFGFGKEMPPVIIEGAAMEARLEGYVDRVDKWQSEMGNFFRVVDYKTGKKSFDYCDVFNGMGLQMLLYMFALEQGGEEVLGKNPLPAGVQYFSARFPFLSEDGLISLDTVEIERGKELKRKGLVLADEKVLSAMEPEGAPQRLSVSRKKDGSLSGDIADRRQFALLKDYVFKILRKLINEIGSGQVAPNPYTRGDSHNACRYCPYGAICHKSSVAGRRNHMAMKPDKFWEELEREVRGNG